MAGHRPPAEHDAGAGDRAPLTGSFSSRTTAAIPYRRPPAAGGAGERRPAVPAAVPGPGAHAAPRPDRAGTLPGAPASTRRRPGTLTVVMVVLLSAAVIAAVSILVGRTGGPAGDAAPSVAAPSPQILAPSLTPPRRSRSPAPSASSKPAAQTRSPRADAPAVRLLVRGDADEVQVRAADLGATLLRVTRLDGGVAHARLVDSGRTAALDLGPDRGRVRSIDVLIDSSVTWSFRTEGSIGTTDIDMTRGIVGRMDLRGGPDVRITLPPPVGTTTVRITGTVARCDVRTPRSVPARISVSGTAGRVVVNGDVRTTGSTGSTLTVGTPGGAGSVDFQMNSVAALSWRAV